MDRLTRAKILLPVEDGDSSIKQAYSLLEDLHKDAGKSAGLVDSFLPNVLNLLSAFTSDYRIAQAVKLINEYLSETKKASVDIEAVKLHWVFDYVVYQETETEPYHTDVKFTADLSTFLAYFPHVEEKKVKEAVEEVSRTFYGVLKAQFPKYELLFNMEYYPKMWYIIANIVGGIELEEVMNQGTEILDKDFSKMLTRKLDRLEKQYEKQEEKFK